MMDPTIDRFVNAARAKDAATIRKMLANGFNVNSIDRDFETALHNACREKGNDEVVGVLLAAKTDVNLRNRKGLTALHLAAAINTGLSVVAALVKAGADVNSGDKDNWTALHYLANESEYDEHQYDTDDVNNKERTAMAEYLLAHGASLSIKTRYNHTPAEHAFHRKCAKLGEYLRDWKPPANGESKEVSKKSVDKRLAEEIALRKRVETELMASKSALQSAISEAAKAMETHKTQMDSLLAEKKQLGLKSKQQIDSANDSLQKQRAIAEAHKTEAMALKAEVLTLTSQRKQMEQQLVDLGKKLADSQAAHQNKAIVDARFSEIKATDFNCKESDLLGEGGGGRVFRARYNGADIAVKYVTSDDEKSAESEFTHEITIMQHIPPHPNVVGFLGGSLRKPFIVTMTLMKGSLEKMLLEDKEYVTDFVMAQLNETVAKTTLDNLRFVVWLLIGASAGLVHLHARRTVHCDVAARNMLVDFNNNCCVCDFGMSQILPEGQSGVETSKAKKIPIPWVAPETLEKRVWSFKSDVYSFGVMMVELMTRQQPYPGMKLEDIAAGVRQAHDSLRPRIDGWWPESLATLATECMSHRAEDRPTMMNVNQKLYGFYKRISSVKSFAFAYFPLSQETLEAEVKKLEQQQQQPQAAMTVPVVVETYKRVPAAQYYINF